MMSRNHAMQTLESLMEMLHEDLKNARKTRDRIRMQTLQSLIARIDNAEAIPADTSVREGTEFFAGASSGVGSTEAIRKELTMADINQIIAEEITELEHTLNEIAGHSQEEYEAELRQKVEVLREIEKKI